MNFETIARNSGRAVADFGAGLIEGAVEQPTNAVLELAGHVSGCTLPKLDIVQPSEDSLASGVGMLAGKVLDIYLLSKVVGSGLSSAGVRETGIAANALRMGTTGAIYGGLFTSSDKQTGNFFYNRFANGLTEGATWATIGAGNSALESTNIFAPRPFRSLTGHVALGALSGAAGGFVHSESNALLHNGRFATTAEVVGDAGSFAVAGGIFGALDYGATKITQRIGAGKTDLPNKFTDGYRNEVTIVRDSSGQITGVRSLDGTFAPGTVGGSLGNEMYTRNASGAWERHYGFPIRDVDPIRTVSQLNDGSVVIVGPTHAVPRTSEALTKLTILEPGKDVIHQTVVTPQAKDIASGPSGYFMNGSWAAEKPTTITRINEDSVDHLTFTDIMDKVRSAFAQ